LTPRFSAHRPDWVPNCRFGGRAAGNRLPSPAIKGSIRVARHRIEHCEVRLDPTNQGTFARVWSAPEWRDRPRRSTAAIRSSSISEEPSTKDATGASFMWRPKGYTSRSPSALIACANRGSWHSAVRVATSLAWAAASRASALVSMRAAASAANRRAAASSAEASAIVQRQPRWSASGTPKVLRARPEIADIATLTAEGTV
jgi:hypothetical protein